MVVCHSCGRIIASDTVRCAKCRTPFHPFCSHSYKIAPEGEFNVCCGSTAEIVSDNDSVHMRTKGNKRRQSNLDNTDNLKSSTSDPDIICTDVTTDNSMRYRKVPKKEIMVIDEKPVVDPTCEIIIEDYNENEHLNVYDDDSDVIIESEIISQRPPNPQIINIIDDEKNNVTLETVWQGISSLQTSISNISNSLDSVSTHLSTIDPRINQLESTLNAVKNKTLNFENVQNDVSGLRNELQNITTELESIKSQPKNNLDISQIFMEIRERESKSRNILIYNVPEDNLRISQDYSTVEDINTFNRLVAARDSSRAREILENIPNIDLDEISTRRLGRVNPNRCRPLRVTLQCKEDVISIMKNRRYVHNQYTVKTDLTKFQQQKIKELKEELDKINVNKNNPTMTIKFVSGEPKIIPIRRNYFKNE